MRALIFAAGFGERMRPLTERTPKPLLVAGGKPLLVWHLEKLSAIGVHEVVINTSHLASQFPDTLGDGSRWNLRIRYSHEGPEPLETGGGMLHALPLLGDAPFIALNGDIWSDLDFATLPTQPRGLAHLLMVDNPRHHPHGDFALRADGRLGNGIAGPRLTFAGIGVYRPALLDDWQAFVGDSAPDASAAPRFGLAPVLRAAIDAGAVDGTRLAGTWTDVGTPERLHLLDERLRRQQAPG